MGRYKWLFPFLFILILLGGVCTIALYIVNHQNPCPTHTPSTPPQAQLIGIHSTYPEGHIIRFEATAEIAQKFTEYGDMFEDSTKPELWWLTVDSRYPFEQVLDYIEHYDPGGAPE